MMALLLLVGFVVTYCGIAFKYVPAPYEWVVEVNLGKTTKKIAWKPGIHVLWLPIRPFMFIRNVVRMDRQAIVLRIGQEEGEGMPGAVDLIDCSVQVIAQVIFRVVDSIAATYEVDNYFKASLNKIEALIRQELSVKTFDQANAFKKTASEMLEPEASKVSKQWGVELVDVAIIDFIPDAQTEVKRRKILEATKDAEAKAIEAEGEKKAAVLKAEGEREAAILAASGRKEADVLDGEGQATMVNEIAKVLGVEPAQAMAYLKSTDYFKVLEKANIVATTGEGGKLITPILDVASAMASIKKSMSSKNGGGES